MVSATGSKFHGSVVQRCTTRLYAHFRIDVPWISKVSHARISRALRLKRRDVRQSCLSGGTEDGLYAWMGSSQSEMPFLKASWTRKAGFLRVSCFKAQARSGVLPKGDWQG